MRSNLKLILATVAVLALLQWSVSAIVDAARGRSNAAAEPSNGAPRTTNFPAGYVRGQRNGALAGAVSVAEFGAIADGTSHPVTTAEIAAHREWRGGYKAGDERDYVALQEAIYGAFGGPSEANPETTGWHKTAYARLNRPLYIPQGSYVINRTLDLRGVAGFRIEGAARLATTITQTAPDRPVLAADGLSYGVIEGLTFSAGARSTEALVEVDWTGAVESLKPQQISINDCVFHGQGVAAYGLRVAKSGATAQGDTILLNNNLFVGCTEAGLVTGTPNSYAFNALSIQLNNGDFQGCPRYGIATYAGSVLVYGTSFQNGDNLADYASFSSINEGIIFSGVRSESMRVIDSRSTQRFIVEGLRHIPGNVGEFIPNTAYTIGQYVRGGGRVFRVTAARSLTAAAPPAWDGVASGGATQSGGVTFQQFEFDVIRSSLLSLRDSFIVYGQVRVGEPSLPNTISHCQFSRGDWLARGVADDQHRISQNLVSIQNVYVTSGAPWGVESGSAGSAPFYSTSQVNFGSQPIIFSRGHGGQSFRDVGIAPGDGVGVFDSKEEDASRNVLAVIGTLGRITRAGTDQRGEDLLVQGGLGTGSGGGGAIRLRAQPPATSGAAVPNAVDKVVIDHRGMAIGGGANISRHLSATDRWDPPSLMRGATATTTMAVAEATVGDVVAVGFSSITEGGWQISAQVTAGNNVTITLTNQTGREVNLNSGTIRVSVTQY
ncbi:MAG: hypothetical protein M3430_15220 [Acidobacteriota bacterium]|nr:hypothetical protein [Acidobacteriota bacterium]